MKPDKAYVKRHPNDIYWKNDVISYSMILNKLKNNSAMQWLMYKLNISQARFAYIFGIHINMPRRIRFAYSHNAILNFYRFQSIDEILDTIPSNKTIYDMSPIDRVFTTKEETILDCNWHNDNHHFRFRQIDDNSLRKHLRNLQLYYNVMIYLTKKYMVD